MVEFTVSNLELLKIGRGVYIAIVVVVPLYFLSCGGGGRRGPDDKNVRHSAIEIQDWNKNEVGIV